MIGWLVVVFMVGVGSGALNYRVGFTHGQRVGDREGFDRALDQTRAVISARETTTREW